MKDMKTHTYRYDPCLLPVCFLLFLFTSCIDDSLVHCPREETHTEVTLTLQLPNRTRASDAGLPEDKEKEINDLSLLLFKTNSAGKQECVQAFTDIPFEDHPLHNGNYIARLKISKGKYHFMLLANVPDKIPYLLTARDKLRETIEKELIHQMTAKWDIAGHSGFPMWGIAADEIDLTLPAPSDITIPMLRMLARINVYVKEDLQEAFKMTAIHLHNPSSKGCILPLETNLTHLTTHYIRAFRPTLPLNAQAVEDPGILPAPWIYGSGEIKEEASCVNAIYAMESLIPITDPEPNNYAWLEIGGRYKGGEETFYRVDFKYQDQLSPLLRNHTYEITIMSINDQEEAKMEVEVQEWNDAEMSNVVFEGKYFLKVSPAAFYFDREQRDHDSFNNWLTITTNHEEGWEITHITGEGGVGTPDWLRIDDQERQGPKGETSIQLLLDRNDDAPRKAEIYLLTGRLIDFVVKVNQSAETVLELFIEDLSGNPVSELFFYEYYGMQTAHTADSIRVRWSPKAGHPCQVEISVSGDEPFAFDDQSHSITPTRLTDNDGTHHYTIFPRKFTEEEVGEKTGNPFLHRGMRVTFTVTDPLNPAIQLSKVLYLRHQHYAIISRNFHPAGYLNSNYTFNVLSNTSWIVEKIEDEGNLLRTAPGQNTPGGNDIVSGQQLSYSLRNLTGGSYMPGEGQVGRKATFYLRDRQGYIPDPVPFTLTAIHPDPNCYILHPGGSQTERTVDIPIRKLFWAWSLYAEQDIGTLTHNDWTPEVIWQAVYANNDLNNNPVGYSITLNKINGGNILEDVLRVTIAANAGVSGNALIGIRKNGTNGYLYSWHIWITDYRPEATGANNQFITSGHTFMNRNLGALEYSTTRTQLSSRGLYFQWGRKDPLRESFISAVTSPEVSAENNLGNTLRNPSLFYRSFPGRTL